MLKSEVQEIIAGRTHWVPVEEAMAASGIGRSRLYQLLDEAPEIKSLSLKRRGCTKGRRLIYLPSLLDFMSSLADRQAAEKAVAA
jgi:hypothetical protein